MRSLLWGVVLACISGCAAAPESDRFPKLTTLAFKYEKVVANFNFVEGTGGDFRFGHERERWDTNRRFELDFRYAMDVHDYFEPFLGAYLYSQKSDWKEGTAEIDCDLLGFGVQTGMGFHPFPDAETRDFTLCLQPYSRIGMGYQDGTYTSVPSEGLFHTGTMSDYRGEFTVGVDLKVRLLKVIQFAAGVGTTWWAGGTAEGISRTGTGVIVAPPEDFYFRGWDPFARFSLGFRF